MHRDLAWDVADSVDLAGVNVVLDVATGTGLVLRALASRDARLHLIGVDISPGMLAVARAALSAAEWIEADAASLPLEWASVDVVTCVTALHIIPDVSAAARTRVRMTPSLRRKPWPPPSALSGSRCKLTARGATGPTW